MTTDRAVLALAGTLVLVSVILTSLTSSWWLVLAGFVGLNLLQSSMTGWCPAAVLMQRAGVPAHSCRR